MLFHFNIRKALGCLCAAVFLVLHLPSFAQVDGEYRSFSSGTWSAAATWEQYSATNSTWATATVAPSGANAIVTVRNGHTVTVTANTSFKKVTIVSGAALISDGTERRMDLIADTSLIVNNGAFGGTGNGGLDGKFNLANSPACSYATITGTGTTVISRLRFNTSSSSLTLNSTLIIDQDITITNSGMTAYYNSTGNTAAENATITINPGKTVTITGGGFHSSSTTLANAAGNYTYNILGTLDVTATGATTYLYPLNNSASTVTINVEGLYKTGRLNTSYTGTNAGNVVLNISGNGVVDVSQSPSLTLGSKFFITSQNGRLKQTVKNAETVVFPIGTSPISYNPVTLSNTGTTDTFLVGVKAGFDYPVGAPTRMVNRQWNITPVGSGGTCTASFGWQPLAEASSFSHSDTLSIIHHNGTQWGVYAPVTGITGVGTIASPYTTMSTALTSFGIMTIGFYAPYVPSNLVKQFKSVASGAWNSNATWNQYDITLNSWSPANSYPENGDTVEIANGYTVSLAANASFGKLTINAGGNLVSDGSDRRLDMRGVTSTLTNNGVLGGTGTNGKIGIGNGSDCISSTIEGTGTATIAGISFTPSAALNTVMNINQNMTLTGTGLSAYANTTANSATEIVTINVNAGKKITITGGGLHTTAATVNDGGVYTYNIYGQVDWSSSSATSYLYPNTNTAGGVAVNVFGKLTAGKLNLAYTGLNGAAVNLIAKDTGLVDFSLSNAIAMGTKYITTIGNGRLRVKAAANSSVTFPVGTIMGFAPFTIQKTDVEDIFTINADTLTVLVDTLKRSLNTQWHIQPTSSSFTSKITMGWEYMNEFPAFNHFDYLRFLKLDGTTWQDVSTTYSITGSGSLVDPYKISSVVAISPSGTFTVGNVEAPTKVENMHGSEGISIYPNPATDKLIVKNNAGWNAAKPIVLLIDALGRKTAVAYNVINNQLQLSVNEMPAGIYILSLQDGDAMTNIQFVKH